MKEWRSGGELLLHSSTPSLLHTLVLGLGNPILTDDGVGWRVVDEVRKRLTLNDERAMPNAGESPSESTFDIQHSTFNIDLDTFTLGGLALMERLIGYRRVVLVDAIRTRDGTPGTVYRLGLDQLPTLNADSAHDASLAAALELGRRLGAQLPEEVTVIAIEAADVNDFGETLTPEVESAVGRAAQEVLNLVCI